ncbi:MAG: hypothetical protein Kow0092_09510 [Deferrisomatales bacterium]
MTSRSAPLLLASVAVALAAACAPPPVRQVAVLDPSQPLGRVEGKRFVGTQVPVTVSAEGTPWLLSTSYPRFLLDQGYEEAGLRQSQIFAWNPATRSSLQISLSPAGPYDRFSQSSIEWLTSIAVGGMEAELDEAYGKGRYTVTHGTAQAFHLEGVPYAARNHSVYRSGQEARENGWIYAFAEPFQIFILYQLQDPEDEADRAALETILSSFRYRPPARKSAY